MNRTLTAAVALAAGLGMAGLAHAQSSAGPATSPNTTAPGMPSSTMAPPTSSQTPNAMQNPGAMSNPSAGYGTPSPQANAQADQGTQDVSPAQIQQAQQQLKSQGLYNGEIDGIVGPQTQTALSRFQGEQGLPRTAQLDPQTMSRLIGAPNGANSSATSPTTSYSPARGTQNPALGTQSTPPPTNR